MRAAAGTVVQPNGSAQETDVADPVDDEGAQTVTDRGLSFVKERDQKDRGESDDLPTEQQKVETAGQDGQKHGSTEQAQKQVVPQEARLSMQVAAREGGGDAQEAAREDRKRNGQSICHQGQREVVPADLEPMGRRPD